MLQVTFTSTISQPEQLLVSSHLEEHEVQARTIKPDRFSIFCAGLPSGRLKRLLFHQRAICILIFSRITNRQRLLDKKRRRIFSSPFFMSLIHISEPTRLGMI